MVIPHGILSVDKGETESHLHCRWLCAFKFHDGHGVAAAGNHLHIENSRVARRKKVHVSLRVLVAGKLADARLARVPVVHLVVGMTEVEHQTLWTALVEGIAMNGAAQRRRHLYVDVIAVEVHAVVAGMGLLGVVGERRGIVVRVEAAAADGHHRYVQQVSVALVSVGKAEDGVVLILIAGSRPPHRHR